MTREKINGYRQSESFGSQWIWGALPYFGFSLGVWVLGIFGEFGIPRSLHMPIAINTFFVIYGIIPTDCQSPLSPARYEVAALNNTTTHCCLQAENQKNFPVCPSIMLLASRFATLAPPLTPPTDDGGAQ